MPKLKPITATKSVTYDPEFLDEFHHDPESVTQAEFEDYVNECALEDLGKGFHLIKSGSEEVVSDAKIYMVWVSPTLDERAEIHPDWYQDNGTPMDSEGQDMEYLETRIIL